MKNNSIIVKSTKSKSKSGTTIPKISRETLKIKAAFLRGIQVRAKVSSTKPKSKSGTTIPKISRETLKIKAVFLRGLRGLRGIQVRAKVSSTKSKSKSGTTKSKISSESEKKIATVLSTKLLTAILNENLKGVKDAIESGAVANKNFKSFPDTSPLVIAFMNNKKAEIAKFLIEKGADVNYKYPFENVEIGLIYMSIYRNNIDLLKVLLKSGVEWTDEEKELLDNKKTLDKLRRYVYHYLPFFKL